MTAPDTFPTTLRDGRYVLDKPLGEGGMAVVYSARDTALGVDRAIKLLLPQSSGRKSLRRRLQSEARAMAQLKHPNILGIHDVGADGAYDYVVMDLAMGGSLQDVVEAQGALPVGRSIKHMVQVLSALATAHAAGIVHRDVKPHNILLDSDGRALLADFGIALLVADDRRTKTGVAMGSLAFMPPEQRLDAARVGPAADIYACGSTLYNLITGKNPVDLFLAASDPSRLDGIPDPLLRVLLAATAMMADDRYATAGAMAADLMEVLESNDGEMLHAINAPQDFFPAPSHAFTAGSKAHTAANAGLGPTLAPAEENLDAAVKAALTFIDLDATPPPAPKALHPPNAASPDAPTNLPVEPEPKEEVDRRPLVAGLALLALGLIAAIALGLAVVGPSQEGTKQPVGAVAPVPEPEPVVRAEPALPEPPEPVAEPNPEPEPEPEPVAVQPVVPKPDAPPANEGPRGSWVGSLGGIALKATLRGGNTAVRGTIVSSFMGNSQTSSVAGSFAPESGVLTLSTTDPSDSSPGSYHMTLRDGRLSGTFTKATGAKTKVAFSRPK